MIKITLYCRSVKVLPIYHKWYITAPTNLIHVLQGSLMNISFIITLFFALFASIASASEESDPQWEAIKRLPRFSSFMGNLVSGAESCGIPSSIVKQIHDRLNLSYMHEESDAFIINTGILEISPPIFEITINPKSEPWNWSINLSMNVYSLSGKVQCGGKTMEF